MVPDRLLHPVRASDARAIFDFELANREYFARFISDRGDDYFAHFLQRHHELLARQSAGRDAYYLLFGETGEVAGRFNLFGIKDGTADVGYRVAENQAGRGLATSGLLELCSLAASRHGLDLLRARVAHDNAASQAVLSKAGFVERGQAEVGPRPGSWYERNLA